MTSRNALILSILLWGAGLMACGDSTGVGPEVSSCGNGRLDPGELCDPPAVPCPASCDDGDACTVDTLVGSAAACDAECRREPITLCQSGDGCCPLGCDVATDGDCVAVSIGPSSSGSEAVTAVHVPVTLSASAADPVSVDYAMIGGTASFLDEGTGKDFDRVQGTLTFAPGETQKDIVLSIVDDDINEVDETIEIMIDHPQHAVLGSNTRSIYTIEDNDRGVLVSVTDAGYGATPDDAKDDTAAVQAAIDDVYNRGGGSSGAGGVVVFPPGTYLVTSVKIRDNITYQGYGAIIKRPAAQGKWVRTFTTDGVEYSGPGDSRPLIIKGLTFDGNSQEQGPYQGYELEQAHLIMLSALDGGGRLRAIIEDCHLRNGPADGILPYRNVDLTVFNVLGEDIFRGVFDVAGDNNRNHRAAIKNLVVRGVVDQTGIHAESYADGPNEVYAPSVVHVEQYRGFDRSGYLTWGLETGTVLTMRTVFPKEYLAFSGNGQFIIADSRFPIATNDGHFHLLWVGDGVFENCDFLFTEANLDGEADRTLALNYGNTTSYASSHDCHLTFEDSRFRLADDVESSDTVKAIDIGNESSTLNNVVTFRGGVIGPGLDVGFFFHNGGNLVVEDMLVRADTAVHFSGSTNSTTATLKGLRARGPNYMYLVSQQAANVITQTDIQVDEAANGLSSYYSAGFGATTFVGHRVILGGNPPTSATNCFAGDIYRLKAPVSGQPHEWQCTDAAFGVNPSVWDALPTVSAIAYFTDYPEDAVASDGLSLTPAGTDIVSYKYRLDDGAWSDETPVATAVSFTGLPNGGHRVALTGKSSGGDWQPEDRATTYYFLVQRDDRAPAGMVTINRGDILTSTSQVTLVFETVDASPVTEMKISNRDDFAAAPAVPFSDSASWELLPGRGVQAVYVWFKDAAGNWTPADRPVVDVIFLDPRP